MPIKLDIKSLEKIKEEKCYWCNRELVAIKYDRQKCSALLYPEVDLSMLGGSL